MLDQHLDIQRLRQSFALAVRSRQLWEASRRDVGFLTAVRRGLLPLPTDRRAPPPERIFPARSRLDLPSLAGRRIGLAATGGSGVLASVVGVARALEEAELRPSVLSLCSGSALFGFPLAAGLSPEEVAQATARLHPPDYVQLSVAPLLRAPVTLGRGFSGFLRGDRVEEVCRRLLGDRCLGDLKIPAYSVVWDGEHDRLVYLGPRTRPDVPVATAIRLSMTLPLMIEAAAFEGGQWFDGGVVDILPVTPLLDLEPPCDVVLVVNGFYPSRLRRRGHHGVAGSAAEHPRTRRADPDDAAHPRGATQRCPPGTGVGGADARTGALRGSGRRRALPLTSSTPDAGRRSWGPAAPLPARRSSDVRRGGGATDGYRRWPRPRDDGLLRPRRGAQRPAAAPATSIAMPVSRSETSQSTRIAVPRPTTRSTGLRTGGPALPHRGP
jgi:NTE family protein